MGCHCLQNAHNTDITAVAVSVELSLVASGDASGTVHIWDYEFFRHEGMCIGHTSAIKAMHFLTPYPVLVVAGACYC